MKYLTPVLAILSFLVAATAQNEETIPELSKRLQSLPTKEFFEYYNQLPAETQKAITEHRRNEAGKLEEKIQAFEKKVKDFERLGIDEFFLFYLNYESASKKVLAQIQDPELREKEKARMEKTGVEFGRAAHAAPAPLVIEVWQKHKDRIEGRWNAYWKIAPDAEALRKIETDLMAPIRQEFRKIIEAEPEPDKQWYERKKWRHLLIIEEPEDATPSPTP